MFSGPASTQPRKEGKPSGRSTPYLFSHRNSPLFRIRIPSDLHSCLGKKEYRRSLGRGYAAETKTRALRLAAAAFEAFSFARLALNARGEGTDEDGRRPAYTASTSGGVSTSRRVEQEELRMAQGNSDHQDVSTTTGLQGRALSSLTDDEIRSIAEAWLLNALKDTNVFLMQAAPLRERIAVKGGRTTRPEAVQEVLESLGYVEKGAGPKEEEERHQEKENASAAAVAAPMPSMDTAPLEEQAKADAALARNIKAIHQKALASNRVTGIAYEADKQLAAHGVTPDPADTDNAAAVAAGSRPSVPYLKTCQELLKARATFYGIMERNHQGDFSAYDAEVHKLEERREARRAKRRIKAGDTPSPPSTAPAGATSPASSAPAAQRTFSDALALFFQEMEREKRWAARTLVKERGKFELFQSIIDPDGTLPVAAIGAEHMRLYKKTLFGLPRSMTISPKYKTIPLPELIKRAQEDTIPQEDRIAPRSIGNHCIQIATFINWAARNEYHNNSNITGLLHVAKAKQEHENRDPYNRDDLARIFAPENFLTAGLTRKKNKRKKNRPEYELPDSGGRASRFWVPLLGLFTGARIEELCQLSLSDIMAVDGEGNARSLFVPGMKQTLSPREVLRQVADKKETLCIFINGGDGKSIKRASSKRYVPISPLLTNDLNFMECLSSVHGQHGNKRVFPELTKNSDIDVYSNAISNWYTPYEFSAFGAGNSLPHIRCDPPTHMNTALSRHSILPSINNAALLR